MRRRTKNLLTTKLAKGKKKERLLAVEKKKKKEGKALQSGKKGTVPNSICRNQRKVKKIGSPHP